MVKPKDTPQNNGIGWQPGVGHNRGDISPEELAAELAELKAAEASTEASQNTKPLLIDYLYEVRFFPGGDLNRGELQAFDLMHAQRQLHLVLGVTHLPVDTKIIEKNVIDEELRQWNAARNRRLLKALTAHHHWLQGDSDGVRADFSNEDLSGVDLSGRNLSHVSMANATLSGANFRSAKLVGADLTGSDLSSANLSKCDLTSASMAEANLIGADLTAANLKGTDLWRANLARCTISPENLHRALGCTEA
ncbi:MAG: pentapeptide repeat-containing protein [Sneathiella sp.]